MSSKCFFKTGREKVAYCGEVPNLEKCIISYQVLRSLLKNVNHYADEDINCDHIINGQLLKNSVLAGSLRCAL
jgi:hypothetical protein